MFEAEDIDLHCFTPNIVLVGGASSIGKTSVVDTLVRIRGDLYSRPLSYTSRPRRPNETESEYTFVSRDEIYRMQGADEILTIDEIYGNLYAISRDSVQAILDRNKIAIKEVHPSNHAKIRQILPRLISVVLFSSDDNPQLSDEQLRGDRRNEDSRYYSNLDPLMFDISFRIDSAQPLANIAQNLHLFIYSQVLTQHYFPSPCLIDSINTEGYTKVASEFSDEHRITTKNFHDLSYLYFADAIAKYIHKGARYIELGVGRDWLSNILPITDINYTGIDITTEMIKRGRSKHNIRASARYTGFPCDYFDVAIASLMDPYCYPAALCEIQRILKPGGFFIFSSPSRCWSDGLRTEENPTKTTFLMKDGSRAEVFSFTFTINELRQLLAICGLSITDYWVICGDQLRNQRISPAIIDSAKNLGIDVLNLPILNFVIAKKGT